MKKYLSLIILLIVIVALILIAVIFTEDEEKYIHEITMNEVVQKIDNEESFMLYIRQTDCEHCKEFTPNFLSVLSKNDLEAYAIHLDKLSDEDLETYNNIFDVTGTPTVLFFDKGNESLIRIEGEATKATIKSKLEATGFIK